MTNATEGLAIASSAAPLSATLKPRLERIRDSLTDGLIERDVPLRLALLAAIAGEHMLLIGPPGTAKSELARRLRLTFSGQAYFERLLTRFSVPEELFGPLSIKALEEDKYQRQTDGYLPTASIAFLDEIFKANSAILNALLTLLNEREFDNGTHRVKTPLVSVVGASNELPQEEELLALYDRFLVRFHVGPVTDEGFGKLLDLRGHSTPSIAVADRLTPQDIMGIHEAALRVTVPAEVTSLLKAMRQFCRDQQIPVSDRRWRKAQFLLQVAAHTDGRSAVSAWDCWLLQHCLWHRPEEHSALAQWYEERAGAASPREPERFSKIAAAWEHRLTQDRNERSQRRDAKGRLVFQNARGMTTTEPHEVDRYGNKSSNAPVMVQRQYARGHIEDRLRSLQSHFNDINEYVSSSRKQLEELDRDIRRHLWLDAAFAEPAARRLGDETERASKALERLEATTREFQQLPIEPDVDPESVAENAEFPPIAELLALHEDTLDHLSLPITSSDLAAIANKLSDDGNPLAGVHLTADDNKARAFLIALRREYQSLGHALDAPELQRLFYRHINQEQ